ncbi:MAG: hypothetical protein JWO49_383 [Arthrobacter sp.]|nr:hypothetical protein [Arthrobacter sp.]MCU1548024.1 hypothetical protein [Arthrobacter sp.]
MAEHQFGPRIGPELAGRLAESMDKAPDAGPPRPTPPAAPEGQHWPDGNGKHRHPKQHDLKHGRMGQEAAVNAVHRTGRPDMPHSS